MKEIRECNKHGHVIHAFEKTNKRWRCTKCRTEATMRRRLKLKSMALDYKGNKCSKCGYDKCPGALDFHHLENKEFNISNNGITNSWAKVLKELDKCVILCANCHRELHYEEFSDKRSELEYSRRKLTTETVECLTCKKEFKQKRKEQKYCSKTCSDRKN